MKRKNLFLTLLMTALVIGFTACENDPDADAAADVAATYSGLITSEVFPIPVTTDVVIQKVAENKVRVVWNDTITGMGLNIDCPADVTKSLVSYHISGTTNLTLQGETSLPLLVSIEGDVISAFGAKTATLNIVVDTKLPMPVPVPPFPITLDFRSVNLPL